MGASWRFLLLLSVQLAVSATTAASTTDVTPCQTGNKASTALLQAARQQLPLQLKAGSSKVVKVSSWEQLVDAVEQHKEDAPAATWTVFELSASSALVASSTVQLQAGMAVVAAGSRQGQPASVRISCQDGLGTAFDVRLTAAAAGRPAGAGVLLQGLHLTGCKGSAVLVSGALTAPQGVQWASLPAGLHLVNTTLAGNAAAVGGGLRASSAAVYLESVQVSGNHADQLGGGVSVDQGLLVALNTHFKDNTAGKRGQMSSLTTGMGAAIHANSSTVLLANSTVTGNTGASVGGCAINAASSQGVILAGCTFGRNKCEGDGGTLVGGDYAASTCVSGGASLMVAGSMPPFEAGNATQCSLAPKHLVHISDSTFAGDMPTQYSCGGSIMLSAAWLELQRSSIAGNTPANRGGAVASIDSAIVLTDTSISNHSSAFYGGSVFQLRGRFWATRSQFTDAFTNQGGGGCVYITDATEVRVSACHFERCVGVQAGAFYYQMMYDKPAKPPPVSIHATRIAHCRAWRDGGALNLVRVNITITDSVFDDNEGYYGGVLNTGNGALSVSRTNFSNNRASVGGQGGTVYSYDHAGAQFTGCTWYNNTAYQGAAVYAATYGGEAEWTFTDCNFTANSADQRGAAMYTTGTNMTFTHATFVRNRALMSAGVHASNSGTKLPLNMAFEGCTMQGNTVEQSAGVAWVSSYANVTLSKCVLSSNRAGQSAGALFLQDTPARLTGCVMAGNTARMAAVLALQGKNSTVQGVDCHFQNNKASDQAGAALLMDASSLSLSRTAFSNNSAATAGGAVVVLDGAGLSCNARCNFSANSAALGGAIAVHSGAVTLTDAVLVGNSAPAGLVTVTFNNQQQRAGSGGALFAANGTVGLSKCSLQGNSAEVQGGALQLMSSAADIVSSRFVSNQATPGSYSPAAPAGSQSPPTAGGAILAAVLPAASGNGSSTDEVLVRLQDSVLSGNTAGLGGALAVVDAAADTQTPSAAAATTGPSLSIQLVGSTFSDNSADMSGGAVFTSLPSASLSLTSSKVNGNTATQGGGGIAAVTPAAVQLSGSTVSSNRAAYCAGMLLDTPAQDSVIRSSKIESNVAGQQAQQARSFGQLPQWNSTGSGGGMCVIPGGTVSVTASSITQNSALHGAGMFVQDCVKHQGKPKVAIAELLQDSSSGSDCHVVVGLQTVISGNKQQQGGSGSALYTTDTTALAVTPGARAGRVANSSSNVVTEAGAADSLAAKPSAVLGGFLQQQGRGSTGPVLLVDSGTKLPAVSLRLVDQLGQGLPPSLLQQLTFKAQAAATQADSRSDTNLLGVTSVVPSAANSSSAAHIQFEWLELQGAPGETLNVSFAVLEAPDVIPAVVQVQLKECTAGQAVQRGRQPHLYAGCTNCTNPLFSFDPSAPQCSSCPPAGTYMVCSGGVLTPADGYWQSHPRSAQLLECPNPVACKPSTAADKLMAAAGAAGQRKLLGERGLLAAEHNPVTPYQQLQCAPGYTGNLCSNCDRSSSQVTQTLSHTCRTCSVSRAGSIALFILLRLFDLSVVLLSVFLVFKERQRRNMAVNGGLVTPDKIRQAMAQGTVVKATLTPHGPLETRMSDQPTGNAADTTGVDTYLQLFIEFMQLLSIFRLTRISVVWRSAAEALLLAMSITPISSYSWVSIECTLQEGLRPQQYALASTLASTYIPVALVLVVCAIVLMHIKRRARRLRYSLKDFPALVPELLLATVKAVAYGYPMVIGSVLGLFSCKQLDTAAQVPGEVNAALGNYWNRDLDTVCFQGSHLTYALAVGVPMLLLVVLYPLVQLLLLRRQARRQPDGLADVSFWANYSVLYQDYKQHLYLWGSMRDLRQLLLVAVVVVLQAYPVQVQMVGGWVLSLALLLSHVSLLPFRTGLLNGLQTAMLAAISLTFYGGVLSSVAGFPAKGAAALQYFTVIFDLLVALVLLGVLIWRARLWLDFDRDGKVTWTDVKQTLQSGGEITSKAASVLVRSVASIGSSASRSFAKSSAKSSARVPKASGPAGGTSLPLNDSQCLEGFSSVNTTTSLAASDLPELPSAVSTNLYMSNMTVNAAQASAGTSRFDRFDPGAGAGSGNNGRAGGAGGTGGAGQGASS